MILPPDERANLQQAILDAETKEDADDAIRLMLQEVVKWGEELCIEHGHTEEKYRTECKLCWQDLRRKAGLEE